MKRFKVIPVQRTEIDMKNRFSEPALISSLPWRTALHFTITRDDITRRRNHIALLSQEQNAVINNT